MIETYAHADPVLVLIGIAIVVLTVGANWLLGDGFAGFGGGS